MLRRLCVAGVLAVCLVPVLLGCAKKKIVAVGNLPPETTVFVQGDLDTVSHTIHIFWFGSDPDGDVLGYEFRFTNPSLPGQTSWSFTTRTDSVLPVPSIEDVSESLFEIRAIDNSGAPRPTDAAPGSPAGTRDATPDSANFTVTNVAPEVLFTNRLLTTDETFQTVTLTWAGEDEDGDASTMRYQLGLDTIPSALRTVFGTSATIDTAQFKVHGVYLPTQPRTAYIRAIDDGGRASEWDSLRWIVRSPSSLGQRPRLLLVDDVPTGVSTAFDSLYYGAARRNLEIGSYAILQLAPGQTSARSVPFRSSQDIAQTFSLFDAVIWYRGQQGRALPPGQPNPAPSTVIRNFQDGFAAYLDRGGHLMIESLYLIEGEKTVGSLRSDWVTRYLGSTGLVRANLTGTIDSTADWSVNSGADLNSSIYDLTLQNGVSNAGLRGFVVRDTHNVAVWGRHDQLSPAVARDIPIAVSVPVPENPPGQGRIIVLTFALAGANVYQNAPTFLDKVFESFGLDDLGPAPMVTSQPEPVLDRRP